MNEIKYIIGLMFFFQVSDLTFVAFEFKILFSLIVSNAAEK